ARGARRVRGAQAAVAPAPEPPRVRHEPALPGVRPAGELPQLLRIPDPAPRRPSRPLPLLRLPGAGAQRLRLLPRRVPAPYRLRDGEGRGSGAVRAARRPSRPPRPRPRNAPG